MKIVGVFVGIILFLMFAVEFVFWSLNRYMAPYVEQGKRDAKLHLLSN